MPYQFTQPGPGRPKGSLGGRAQVLQLLDNILARADNQKRIGDAIQKELEKDPLKFLRQIIYPLLPQNVRLDLTTQASAPWGSLADLIAQRRAAAALPGQPAITQAPAREPLAITAHQENET